MKEWITPYTIIFSSVVQKSIFVSITARKKYPSEGYEQYLKVKKVPNVQLSVSFYSYIGPCYLKSQKFLPCFPSEPL